MVAAGWFLWGLLWVYKDREETRRRRDEETIAAVLVIPARYLEISQAAICQSAVMRLSFLCWVSICADLRPSASFASFLFLLFFILSLDSFLLSFVNKYLKMGINIISCELAARSKFLEVG